MIDLDEQIVQTLRERAEGDVDPNRLLRASRARGRRRQTRRQVAAGTALALVGALGFAGVTGTGLDGLTGRLPWTATAPAEATPVPPRVDGVPGAAADPALIGTDPNVLHFGLDPTRARYLSWEVLTGRTETVRFSVRDGQPVHVDVSRSAELPTNVTFDGASVDFPKAGPQTFDGAVQPAAGTAGGLVKSWQPAPGVYARAFLPRGGRAGLEQAVEALRWNEARRCAAPLRLGALPESATISSCSVDITSYPRLVTAQFTLLRAKSQVMSVRYRYVVQAGTHTGGNRTIAGRPAFLSADGRRLELFGIPRTEVIAEFDWEWEPRTKPRFTEADATTVLAGARVIEDPTRLENWE
ncbi:hypothetical protein GA0070607_3653 [Micromonospora coriariae]|uniref:Uncharacterized protein n=1 Tax=Micromonospora coriariae TaxID=285665 RepID=A0A1C4WHH3_9ACTN|nr:hypothetical protein [Micromonospora coriariae]SCE95665.1 hypothetical protein GA0070607_3653 [Micromonospora coriariae]